MLKCDALHFLLPPQKLNKSFDHKTKNFYFILSFNDFNIILSYNILLDLD